MHAVDPTCVPMALKENPQLNRSTSVVEVLGAPSASEKPDSQTDFSAQGQRRTIPRVQVSLSSAKRLALRIKDQSECIQTSHQSIYKLKLTLVAEDKEKGVAKYQFGKPRPDTQEYVVMLVGATGAGKSTLINGMVNYILGVDWEDDFRFKLIADEGGTSQAHSQTKTITAYTIPHQQGSPFEHTLTIVDTPGFGELDSDRRIVEQIKTFFSIPGKKGIDPIHGIGFVTQASMVRLTHTQKYIFDSILSIFGNDIEHNILLMITFADNRKPAVLDAVKAARIPYTRFFKFNNSALFPEPPDAQSGNADGGLSDALYWKLCMGSFDYFAKTLVTMQAQSLTLTREVLEERQQFETVMQSLQVQMKLWVRKIAELKQEERCMEEIEAKIAANENFTYTVKTQKIVKHDLSGTGIHVMNCLNCNYTCHRNCAITKDNETIKCYAMKDGWCTVCPKQCRWNRHVSNPWRFEVTEETEERTYDELKQRYDEATQAKSRVQVMVANIQATIRSTYDESVGLLVRARQTLQRLDEIALKPNPLSQVEYIDLLIQCEKERGKEGYQERIKYLNEVRGRAKLLSMVRKKDCDVHQDLAEAAKIASGTTTHS